MLELLRKCLSLRSAKPARTRLTTRKTSFALRTDKHYVKSNPDFDHEVPENIWQVITGLMKMSQTELPIVIPFLFHLIFLT